MTDWKPKFRFCSLKGWEISTYAWQNAALALMMVLAQGRIAYECILTSSPHQHGNFTGFAIPFAIEEEPVLEVADVVDGGMLAFSKAVS